MSSQGNKLVQDSLTAEDELTELSILRSKIEVVLNCLIGNANTHDQTLIDIARDYLVKMGEMIQTMQKSFL